MKKYLIALLLAGFVAVVPAWAQDCAPPSRLEKNSRFGKVFERYTQTFRNRGAGFVPSARGPMGIYLVTEYRNAAGQDCYRIEICLDDRWKQHVPTRASYWDYNSEVILFFQGDSLRRKLPTAPRPDELTCFERIVGDRVFLLPPKGREVWTITPENIRNGSMKKNWMYTQPLYGGNIYNSAVFIPQPDGTFTMLLEV